MVVQDGIDSGQTVEHVHCHIVPKADGLKALDNE
jgi:diadenosine tetraphosphate (Ap4A) HIT family hydrolase